MSETAYIVGACVATVGAIGFAFSAGLRFDYGAGGAALLLAAALVVGIAGIECAREGGRLSALDEHVAVGVAEPSADLEVRGRIGDAAPLEDAARGEPDSRAHGRSRAAHRRGEDAHLAKAAVVEDERDLVRIEVAVSLRHAADDVPAAAAAPAGAEPGEGDAHGRDAEVDGLDDEGRGPSSGAEDGAEADGDALAALAERPEHGEERAEDADNAANDANEEGCLLNVHAPIVADGGADGKAGSAQGRASRAAESPLSPPSADTADALSQAPRMTARKDGHSISTRVDVNAGEQDREGAR